MTLGRKDIEKGPDGGFAALKARRIQRGDDAATRDTGDPVINTTPTKANLLQVKKPHYITAVGLPANESAFKVVREDAKAVKPTKPEGKMANHPILRRTRRSDASPVLRLTFPAGVDEETVNTALKTYGLDGYKVEQQDGVYVATRADVKSITKSKTTDISLTEDGLVATVARTDGGVSAQEPKSGLALSSIEFDSTKFTLDEVKRWAADKCVDGTVQEPQNPDECYVVRRSDVPENEETRRMVLEDGVQAVIVRSDVMDVPEGYVAVVNETAYGNWGWGQLDFAAALGDQLFSETMRNAIVTLDDVLRNIVIWSPLPLDMRKELANRALAQFGDYIGNVMDSLPHQLLVAVVRSANHFSTSTQQEKAMTQKETSAATTPEAKPIVESSATTTAAEVTANDNKTVVETPITRADVLAMITEGVTAALKANAPVVRNAEATTPVEEAKPAAVTRADLESAMKALVEPMTEAIKGLQGTTVLRSSPESVPEKDDGEPKDVFRGARAFSGLRVAKR